MPESLPPPRAAGFIPAVLFDALWFLFWTAVSSAWCLTAAPQLERHVRRTHLRPVRPGTLAQRQHGRPDAPGNHAAARRCGDAAALPLGAPARRPPRPRRPVLPAAAVGQGVRPTLLVAASVLRRAGGAVAGRSLGRPAGRRAAGVRTQLSRQRRSGYYGYRHRRLSAGPGVPFPRRARRPVAAARRLAGVVVRRRRAGQGVGAGLRRPLPDRGRGGTSARRGRGRGRARGACCGTVSRPCRNAGRLENVVGGPVAPPGARLVPRRPHADRPHRHDAGVRLLRQRLATAGVRPRLGAPAAGRGGPRADGRVL